jgi:hypothetical protein
MRNKSVGQESVSVENSDLVQQPKNDLISENITDTFDSDESLQSESDVSFWKKSPNTSKKSPAHHSI